MLCEYVDGGFCSSFFLISVCLISQNYLQSITKKKKKAKIDEKVNEERKRKYGYLEKEKIWLVR